MESRKETSKSRPLQGLGLGLRAQRVSERVSAKAESDQMGYCTQYSTLQILSV